MQITILALTLLLLTMIGYRVGRKRATVLSGDKLGILHSLPSYHG